MPRPYLQSKVNSHSQGSLNQSQEDLLHQKSENGSSVFDGYMQVCDESDVDNLKDEIFKRGLLRVKEYLDNAADNVTCLICLGDMTPSEAVWDCRSGCFAIFHLVCIQGWARSQLDAAAAKAATRLSPEFFPGAAEEARATAEWGCPKCRFPYPRGSLPTSYTCFCTKKQDPEWDPWVTPHSCGELCGLPLPGACEHTCMLLCHPGPCPPCPRVIDASCFCERVKSRRRCGYQQSSCGAPCNARLACVHMCSEPCHPGPCPPCSRTGIFACNCGSERRQVPCSGREYQCSRVCNKQLPCGHHTCEKVCHKGPCGVCPRAAGVTCPCGKLTHPELSCMETVPSCGGTCGKALACGYHTCQERCHPGACSSTCRERVMKVCRCGKTQREALCTVEVTCERRCAGMRDCGRHACKRRCCDGRCPPCEEVCGRRLTCSHHRCPAPCHMGPCRPCPLVSVVMCACGAARVTIPCGAERRAVPPRCSRRCAVQPGCRHAQLIQPHACHYGPCPPCRFPCSSLLPCGHPCSTGSCHDVCPPAVPAFTQPLPPKAPVDTQGIAQQPPPPPEPAVCSVLKPWEAQRAAKDTLTPCPPCRVAVGVQCLGGHVVVSRPCCSAAPFSCSDPCGRPLACGNHTCTKPCHSVSGVEGSGANDCEACSQPCSKERPCGHPCPARCHPGACAQCDQPVRTACRCGKTQLTYPCHQLSSYISSLAKADGGSKEGFKSHAVEACTGAETDLLRCGKPCHRALPLCNHPCRTMCHAGACPQPESCAEEVAVRCECKRQKAKWTCARVQESLVAAGRPRSYDSSTALRLIPCDAQCESHKKTRTADGTGSTTAAGSTATAGSSSGRAGTAESGRAGKKLSKAEQEAAAAKQEAESAKASKKMSKAEREAAAAQREAQRLRVLRMHKLISIVIGVLMGVTALVMAFLVYRILTAIDQKAQAQWGASDL